MMTGYEREDTEMTKKSMVKEFESMIDVIWEAMTNERTEAEKSEVTDQVKANVRQSTIKWTQEAYGVIGLAERIDIIDEQEAHDYRRAMVEHWERVNDWRRYEAEKIMNTPTYELYGDGSDLLAWRNKDLM